MSWSSVALSAVDEDLALALEHPGDAALLAQVAAVLRKDVADLAHRAIAIIGGHHDQNGRAAGTVAFEHDFVDLAAFELAGAAHDGALDVIGGHADGFGGDDGGAQARVGVGIAAIARGNHNFLDHAGEYLPAFGVKRGLLVLDCPMDNNGVVHPMKSADRRDGAALAVLTVSASQRIDCHPSPPAPKRARSKS